MRVRVLTAAAVAAAAGFVLAGAPVASARTGAGGTSAASTAASTVRHINVGGYPGAAAVDPRRGAVWVGTGAAVVRIREATQRIAARVRFSGYFVAVDPARGVVWAVDQANGTIAEISEQTSKVTRTLSVNATIEGLAVDSRTRTVWVTGGASLYEFSEMTGRLLHTMKLTNIAFKAPYQVAVDARRGVVWVVIQGDGRNPAPGRLVAVSESTHRVVRSVLAGLDQAAIAIDQRAGNVLVANIQTVDVVTESTGRVRQLSKLLNNGAGIAVDPSAGKVVVTGQPIPSVGKIFVLGERTGKLLRTITGYIVPQGPAVDIATGNVYVPISFRGSVTQFRV
ncbi:MAG: NHL repeat-containing protein [Streptosporangiaceae bacterium]